jgi:molecular chaperone DnaK (HSP70)
MQSSRYIVGIDLGTTNTAVCFVDTAAADPRVESFEVAQLVAPGELDRRRQLPSFVYLAGEHDLGPTETALPWGQDGVAEPGGARIVVGELARAQGVRQPSRMIASAKSWLCHPGVDRKAAILPWGVQDGPRLSPVDSSARVLAHVRAAWDQRHREPGEALGEQQVIVTVPASFDEAARELTLDAAARAGLPEVVLLEEPQAAFYAWMNRRGPRRRLAPGQNVLVFDVGGGTTDFTVIAVGTGAGGGEGFSRTAVGDHLLLGGDNIDLTLAKTVEARLVAGAGRRLDAVEWHGLVHACRLAKETLLANPDVASLPITVSGRSSKLIGSTLRDELGRGELEQILFDGFFPDAARDERPRRSRGGLQEFGLPYAADAAITRHLAAFLTRHGVGRVDVVLFNGGAMTPAPLRQRVIDQIARWQPDVGPPEELSARTPELAVAQGAAHYGLGRRGLGARIGGGTARTFYVGVAQHEGGVRRDRVVCLAPRGLEEGTAVALPRDFQLTTNRPVSFKLYSSSTRADEPGAVLDREAAGDDLLELPPIVTVLRAPGRSEVTVRLEVRITALGALEIWCNGQPGAGAADNGDPGHWRLSFDLRAGGARVDSDDAGSGDSAPAAPDPRLAPAQALLERAFAGPADDTLSRVLKLLEEALGQGRNEWPLATARALFDKAFALEEQRKRSAHHEARWLNVTGFCLRPGAGAPLDDWRARQMWRIFNEDLVHPGAEQVRQAWWITWRRIAAGLNKGHQHQIYLRLAQLFLPGAKGRKKWDEVKPSAEEAAEMLRCLANLERLSPEAKIALGDELERRLESRRVREDAVTVWTLARLGARMPLYGPLNAVVPPDKAAVWIATLLRHDWPQPEKVVFSLAQLARRTGDRGRDLDDEARARVAAYMRAAGATRAVTLVEEVVALESREQSIALGDTLPPGLRLAPVPD